MEIGNLLWYTGIMAAEHLHGIVLRTYNLTESSKIVVMLTPERGKLRSVAKGVRRTKSKFGSSLEPITLVEAEVFIKEGRDLQNLSQAETREPFSAIRTDLKRLGLASVMCELMEQMVQENEESTEYFSLLLSSLTMLSAMTRNCETLLIFFYLKLLDIAGIFPELHHCIRCRKPAQENIYLDAGSGGVLCAACSAGMGEKMSHGSLRIMERLMKTDWLMLERIKLSVPMVEEMLKALNTYFSYHTGRELKSSQFLRSLSRIPVDQ